MGGLPRLVSHRTPSFWAWFALWLMSALVLGANVFLLHRHAAGSAERALLSGQRILIDPATGKITGQLPPATEKPQAKTPHAPPPIAAEETAKSPRPENPPTPTPLPVNAPVSEAAVKTAEPPSKPEATAETSGALAPVRPELREEGKDGPLPVVSKAGLSPLHAYARPATPQEGKPKVALLVMQMGLNPALAQAVLALPPGISVSVSPYAPKPAEWLTLTRARGHEALLDLPMEPRDFPISDAGPYALSPREDAAENQKRLHWVLERGTGYVGLAATPREHFLSQSSPAAPILQELQQRGLLLITSSPRAALVMAQMKNLKPAAQLNAISVLDEMLAPEAVDAQLAALEAAARKDGQALAILRPYPLSIARVKVWLDGLEARGLQLVPATALLPPAEKETPKAEPEKEKPSPKPAH